jgi:hypothetical protein
MNPKNTRDRAVGNREEVDRDKIADVTYPRTFATTEMARCSFLATDAQIEQLHMKFSAPQP